MSVIINDNGDDAFEEIRGKSNEVLLNFVEDAEANAIDRVHRITGNLSRNINHDNPEEGSVRLFSETGYGGFEELREGHAYIAPAIQETIAEYQEDGKWR